MVQLCPERSSEKIVDRRFAMAVDDYFESHLHFGARQYRRDLDPN